jgi:hypothetical protein
MQRCFFYFLLFLLLGSCATKILPPIQVPTPDHYIDYLSEVKPILDNRCVVCHSCYNSPCQLKLSSYEGLDRGATKKAIYKNTVSTVQIPNFGRPMTGFRHAFSGRNRLPEACLT